MGDISISLSKEEVTQLLKLVYTGSYVLDHEHDEKEKIVKDLIQKYF